MEPLVSIITPMYNSEKYIGKTIESVLNQTYKNWEMLIINDCSTDNGADIVKKYQKLDKRIKLFNNSINKGVSYSRNYGIEIATGKYIAFLDSDDLWKNNKLQKQISFMEENDIILSYSAYEKINEDGSKRGIIKVPKVLDYTELLKNCLIGLLTSVYRKEDLRDFRFSDNKCEDYIFWLEILKIIKNAYGIEEPLAQYRVVKNSRSGNKIKIIKFHWYIYRKIEKLNIFLAAYYYIIYIFRGIKRYRK